MKNFIITTTQLQAALVMAEVLRIDPDAQIAHRQENRTVMRVKTRRMSRFTLEAIDGVAQVVDADIIRLALV